MGISLEKLVTTFEIHTMLYITNHVFESESGHIREYDDTANNTRIHERHVSGTSYEIDALKNKTDLVVGDVIA